MPGVLLGETPTDLDDPGPRYVTMGGLSEAFDYARNDGALWRGRGLAFLRHRHGDLGQVTEDKLAARGLSLLATIGLVLLKHTRDGRERFLRSRRGLMDLFRPLGSDGQITILSYTAEVVDFSSLREGRVLG